MIGWETKLGLVTATNVAPSPNRHIQKIYVNVIGRVSLALISIKEI